MAFMNSARAPGAETDITIGVELGFTGEQIEALLAAKIARQLED